jgi:Ca2+-binding RTX toxin-like protein
MSLTSNAPRSIDWGSQVDGTNANGGTVTYSFGAAGTETTALEEYGLGIDLTSEAFNAYEIGQFNAALQLIENVTNLTFQQTGNYSSADLRFLMDTNQFGFLDLGIMAPPGTFGEGLGAFNGSNWDRTPGGDLELGGFGFATIMHEILHGMGLAHPHDNGGGSPVMTGVTSPLDDYGSYNFNQGVFTAMTYNSGHLSYAGAGAVTVAFNYGYEVGPMALDIAVLQDKYGANTSFATGNNVYNIVDSNGSGTAWSSIWDAGGDDLIRYTGSRNVTIDLREATLQNAEGGGGYLSAASGIQGGYTIAKDVVIENAQGGSGNDTLTGNTVDNLLTGNKGDDAIKAFAGDDTLYGGNGNDTLTGGRGDDQMVGGRGNDRIVGQRGEDNLTGSNGRDVLNGGGDEDTLNGNAGDDFVNGGNGNDRTFGNRNDDTLNGGSGNDLLNGGGDDDRLDGGTGDDTLKGGAGEDTFVFNDGSDRDVILDFDAGDDILLIGSDLLNGQTTGQAILDAFGTETGGGLVLNFGGGDVLTLEGIVEPDFDFLVGQIEISGPVDA